MELAGDGDGSVFAYGARATSCADARAYSVQHAVDGVAPAAEFYFVHQNESGDRVII